MEQEILKFFMEKGFLLDKEMLNFFSQLHDEKTADKIIEKIKIISGERVITKSLVNKNINEMKDVFSSLEDEKKKVVERFFVNLGLTIEIKKERYIETQREEELQEEQKIPVANHLQITSPNIIPAKNSRWRIL